MANAKCSTSIALQCVNRVSKQFNDANGAKEFSLSDRPHIVIIGASGRFLAASALAARCPVFVIDLFSDADTRQICCDSSRFSPIGSAAVGTLKINCLQHFARAPELSIREKFQPFRKTKDASDRLIIFSGGSENVPRLFEPQLLDNCVVAGPSKSSIQSLLCLKTIQRSCDRNGINYPRTVSMADQPISLTTKWLRKLTRSGGGLQTALWAPTTPVEFGSGGYLQEMIAGQTISGCYVAARCDGKTETQLLGTTIQHTPCNDEDFRYHGSIGPVDLPRDIAQEISRIGQCIADSFQLLGVFGIDFILWGDKLLLIDINPRVTASAELIERYYRMSIPTFTVIESHLDACLRNRLPSRVGQFGETVHSKQIVYWVSNIPLLVDSELSDYLHAQPHVTDIPVIGSEILPNHPLVTVHARAKDVASVRNKSTRRVETLRLAIASRQLL